MLVCWRGFLSKRCMKALTYGGWRQEFARPSTLSLHFSRELIPILWIGSIFETANSSYP